MAPDLRDVFKQAAHRPDDDVDLGDVRRRAHALRRARRVRGGTVAVAAAVLLGVGISSVYGTLTRREVEFTDTQPTAPPTVVPEPTQEPTPASGWQPLPEGPLSARVHPSAVWTGREVIWWGGQDPEAEYAPVDGGAAYDPVNRTWRRIADAPVEAHGRSLAVWTGTEMVVWTPWTPKSAGGGAAYNPDADTWRRLPDPPTDVASHASAVWTGNEMILWGGYGLSDRAPGTNAGVAYAPSTDAWRVVAESPLAPRFYHGAVWTGVEMLIWGGAVGDGAEGRQFADGAAYNPSSDSWRSLPDAPLAERSDPTVAWTGTEMLVFAGTGQSTSFLNDGAAYDTESDRWRPLRPAPDGGPWDAAWADGVLVARSRYDTGDPRGRPRTLLYDGAADSWSVIDGSDHVGTETPYIFTGQDVVAWGGGYAEWALNTGASIRVDDTAPAQDTVAVFYVRTGAMPYERESFIRIDRAVDDALDTPRQRLATALRELVKGPTPAERREQDVESTFSDATRDLVLDVTLERGVAVVNLDSLDVIPGVSTSHASSVFFGQLHATVFAVPEVDQVRYELQGDCEALSILMQGGPRCQRYTREWWDGDAPLPAECTDAPVEQDARGGVLVFFFCTGADPPGLRPVRRAVPDGEDPLTVGVAALLDGPSRSEVLDGYSQATTDEGLSLIDADLRKDGTAVVDLAGVPDQVDETTWSFTPPGVMAELTTTLFFVDGVEAVEFRADGSCERFWGALTDGNECRLFTRQEWEQI